MPDAVSVHFAAKKFDTDLTPRKSTIMLLIEEELQKLAEMANGGTKVKAS